jgi:carboxypeptidase Taq
LGNLYAVQLYEQAKRDIPRLEDDIASGQLMGLRRWLEQKVHRWGRTFSPDRLVERVTGSTLQPEPFLRYLDDKYRRLYRLAHSS